MDSALPNSELKVSFPRALNSLRTSVAFLMLGGASLMLMLFLLLLRIPQIIMQDNIRNLLQFATGTTLTFVLLFSYPHFVWSYKFAYQQGTAFIIRHRWQLLAYPMFIAVLLAICVSAWNLPVSNLPIIGAIDNQLRSLGVDLHWSLYNGCGQLLLASLFICQTIMAGHHYCMQAFGVSLACGEDGGYRLTTSQKHWLRFNLYALWAMNLFSGYTFFAILNNANFVYHPVDFPPFLNLTSNVIFALSILTVIANVVIPVFRQTRKLPPALAVLPVLSVWIWLQPFCQPFGFQAWVVPLAHGAQYLYFAYRVENNSFDPIVERKLSTSFYGRLIYLVCLTGIVVALGYAGFMYIPVMLDRERLLPDVTGNFFLLAAFLFISLHHYMVDAVVWKHDSRARKLLRKTAF
jgi:hypothetical protein